MLQVGEYAPELGLESDRGGAVQLSDFRGRRVVIFFYPKDNTSG